MLRLLFIAVLAGFVPMTARANPHREMTENDFLDLVDDSDNVLIQARGVDAVDAKARDQGLPGPALGYWSVEGHCFVEPAPGDCNGVIPPGP